MIPKNYKIDQRYSVEKSLGDGLSGEVLLVSDEDGLKALKFLKKVQMNLSREEALKNFKNEFAILKELNHPNISRILDFGFDTKLQKYYFTTEYVAGGNIEKVCEALPLAEKERLIVQVLRALNYLHSRGIFHYDIKPQNILVDKDESGEWQAKVIDFGLSGYHSLSKKVGTPLYMAPEMIRGGHLDGRTDLYSLGAMTYKLLTGKNPFQAPTFRDIINKHLQDVPEPASQINPAVTEYWDHILARLLEKEPDHRYSQAALVIRDLNFLSNRKIEIETRDTKLSYLPEKGTLVAREKSWAQCVRAFENVFTSPQASAERLLIIEGEKGTGKTRLLSELKYHSQLQNVPVKTLAQYSQEKDSCEKFVLLIDEQDLDVNAVNALMSDLMSKHCLIIWAVEKAPKNWSGSLVVTLTNYNKIELKTYLELVTGLSNAPESLIEDIYKRTQGNPLFVAEFIKSLLEQNLLYDESGQWDATKFEDIKIDFEKINIPESVEDLLKSRFFNLAPDSQKILQWLSVNSNPLTFADFATLLKQDENQLRQNLQNLVNDDFLAIDIFKQQYTFKNLVNQDIICNLLAPVEVDEFHKRLAEHFVKDQSRLQSYLYHLGFAKQADTAKTALRELAEIQLADNQRDKAIATMQRFVVLASGLFVRGDEDVFLKLGNLYTLSSSYAGATQVYRDLLQLVSANEQFSADELIPIYNRLIDICNKQNFLDEVEKYCDVAEKLLPKIQKQNVYRMILANYRAHLLLKRGQQAEAKKSFESTRAEWQTRFSVDDKRLVMNNRLVDIYNLSKDLDAAIRFCSENIAVLQDADNDYDLALNYYGLGDSSWRQSSLLAGDDKQAVIADLWQTAEKSFKACEEISKKTHHYNLLLRAYNGLGNLYFAKKEIALSLEYYKRTLAIAQKIGEFESAANTAFNIANIYITQKNFQDSYSYLIYAINTFEHLEKIAPQSQEVQYLANLSLSEVYYHQDELQKAHAAIDKAARIFAGNASVHHYEYWMTVRRAMVCAKEKNEAMAQELYIKAKQLAQTDEEKADLKTVAVLLSEQCQNRFFKNEVTSMATNLSSDADLGKIIEINQIMNTEYDTPQLLKIVLKYAVELTQAEGGAVLLLNGQGLLEIAESLNLTAEEKNKISMSIAGQALQSGNIVESSDALTDERFDASQSVVINELQSVLCLPIKSKNRSIGVFYLDNRFKKNAFAGSNVTLLKAFCDQVAIALQTANLVSELRQAKDELKEDLNKKVEELEDVRHRLHEQIGDYNDSFGKNIVSKSKAMHDIFRLMDKIIHSNLAIFIHGESGTGKELIAKALHHNHPTRSKGRFVAINCGAIPANLMESELFGHKMGSFTGAIRDKKGLFEEASGGTLFLDEIGEMPLELQVKLLRVLQEGEVQRVGDGKPTRVDVRIVCASHHDIEKMVKQKSFREDLFYRLCQMKIHVPALRERREDIPELVKHFVKKYADDNGLPAALDVPSDFMRALLAYDWPGNIRELESLISVACALAENNRLSLESLPENYAIKRGQSLLMEDFSNQATTFPDKPSGARRARSEKSLAKVDADNFYEPSLTWRDYEILIFAKAYELSGWKKKQMAQWLDLSNSTVYKKIDEYQLDDRNNPAYGQEFVYDPHVTLAGYVEKIFLASLKHHQNHPYSAIKVLDVSQGYFYKVIRDKRHLLQESVQDTI